MSKESVPGMRPNFDNQWTDNDEPVLNWPNLGIRGDALDLRRLCGGDGASLRLEARSLRAGGGIAESLVENR